MPDVVCDLPEPLSHEKARDVFKQVKKEMPGLQESQYRREAARRLNVDYDTYLKAWKKPGPAVRPKPGPAPAPKTMPNAPQPKPPVHTTPEAKPNFSFTEEPPDGHPFGRRIVKENGIPFGYLEERQLLNGQYRFILRDNNGRVITESFSRQQAHAAIKRQLENEHMLKEAMKTQALGPTAQPRFNGNGYKRRDPIQVHGADMDLVGDMQILEDMRSTNPGYLTNRQYQVNCVHVVQAHEMRRRGWDVVATKLDRARFGSSGRNAQMAVQDAWMTIDGKRPIFNRSNLLDIHPQLMNALPEGGRAWVTNVWENKNGRVTGAHIFNVEKVDGKLWIYEAQSGSKKPWTDYAKRSGNNFTWMRADDLVPMAKVEEFIEDAATAQARFDKVAAKKAAKEMEKRRQYQWRMRDYSRNETWEEARERLALQPNPPADWTYTPPDWTELR